MPSGRGKKENAKEARLSRTKATGANGAADEPLEAVLAM